MLSAATAPVTAALLAGGAPDATALVADGRAITYADLAERVTQQRDALDLPPRSMVVLQAANTLEFVVAYLALLAGDHVPLLAGDHAERLAAAWRPEAIVVPGVDGISVERWTRPAGHALHPDLALLLSTSGSTGAAKLVRLSHENVVSNARAIGAYLDIGPSDRAVTSLPLHYCYGLSVLHSHLLAGAGVVLTSASVVDPCFATALREHGVTNVAGVPHTFQLLERAGPEVLNVPTLRFLTQAGGRMTPEQVRRWAARAAGWGADFYVMYGQTEATARMAYLPPRLAARRPDAVGVPIPGGRIDVRPVDGAPDGVGELVYRGPNVMLGYATTGDDLATGATLTELATGDLGRYDERDGVFVVVGRRSRFVKPFGLRIDLDAVEADLVSAGIDAAVAGDDERVVVRAPHDEPGAVRRQVLALTGLPTTAVRVTRAPIPRTPSGKVDHGAILRDAADAADAVEDDVRGTAAGTERAPTEAVRPSAADVFAAVLGRSDATASSTFVSLGGDSLNYIECSVRLEQLLGRLPSDWHLMTVGALDAIAPRRRRSTLDTTALLRTIGIVLVVSTHMSLWYFPGGAHLMLAVVGYNVSRFHLSIERTRDRIVASARSIGRVALPVVAWVGICMLLVGGYSLPTLGLANNYLGPESHLEGRWHYWFIEAVVQLLVVTTVLLAIPAVRRTERRFPYAFPLVALGGALLFRYHWLVVDGLANLRFRTHGVAWFFLLGWLAHRSATPGRKLLTTALCVLTIPGFFQRPEREWLIAAGIMLLLWCRELPMPRWAIRPLATVAAASMWIYISHFRVWPPLTRNLPIGLAYVLTIVAGVAIWKAADLAGLAARRALSDIRLRRRPRAVLAVAAD